MHMYMYMYLYIYLVYTFKYIKSRESNKGPYSPK